MTSKNEAVQLINSVRKTADRREAGGLTLEVALFSLIEGDPFDIEFWNAVEYAIALMKALEGEEL